MANFSKSYMVAPSKKVKVLTAKVEAEDQEPAMCTEPETKAKMHEELVTLGETNEERNQCKISYFIICFYGILIFLK